MVRHPRIPRIISSSVLHRGALWFLAVYVLMQSSGLFGLPSGGIMRILHQWPALAGTSVLIAASVAALIAERRSAEQRSGRFLLRVLLHCGLIMAGLGIVLSSLTRFEGSLVLAEGQEGQAAIDGTFDPSTFYTRRFSRWPDENLAVLGIAPLSPSPTVNAFFQRKALVLCRDRKHPAGREVTVYSAIPTLIRGYSYRIVGVGYSPHVQLFDATGNAINDGYVVMDLYPPGSEDYFRLPQISHTVSVRYYPDAAMVKDQAGALAGKTGPVFKVRVSRNLDLVENRYVSPNELVSFDEHALLLLDVKPWVEIRIILDPGLYLVIPGLIMAAAGALALVLRKTRKGKEGRLAAAANQ